MASVMEKSFEPLVLITPRLIIIPTPTAVSLSSYRALYSSLHANAAFCEMAFGHHFPPRTWSDDETREVIQTRDIQRCWERRDLGDFAVALLPAAFQTDPCKELCIIKGPDCDQMLNQICLEELQWVGYAGVRDATTTSLPPREAADPALPPWQEMIEVRYGVSPQFWGQGLATEAAKAVMQWSVDERGVKRFIAETERENTRSAKVLQKFGFTPSGTDYWKEPTEIEWECTKLRLY
ncbi:unnamed protein product [Penicillium olsonii]|uniref:N-acetyltransferase domain-containing protein n=1 Tax=Penicillium olsonii TaxID=99116 RepID=A0A9W4MKV2_PENOL|nr:unnamed protein product [Penicillium olsonii]CAG8268754.1 unnamed protein product [Penicillium olsonii]